MLRSDAFFWALNVAQCLVDMRIEPPSSPPFFANNRLLRSFRNSLFAMQIIFFYACITFVPDARVKIDLT